MCPAAAFGNTFLMSDGLHSAASSRAPLRHRLAKIWRPAWYQDGRKARGYFEGWYFKCVGVSGEALAVIPGVALGRPRDTGLGGHPHAFVQLIRTDGRTRYWEFPAEDFRYAADRFEIRVAGNRFSDRGLELDLEGEPGTVTGSVEFDDWRPWPVRALAPGIMGWYRFVPFMETYHGVLSLDHGLSGSLDIDGERLDVSGGRGYVEKDWGRSFPSAWLWAQTNHFEEPGISLTLSVARIPWMGSSFVGYIAGLLRDGTLHPFTTYGRATLDSFRLAEDGATLHFSRDREELSVTLEGARPGRLRSPVLGEMEGEVRETLEGIALVELRRSGRTVFAGTATPTAMELMDPHGELARELADS
jgi:hypothetical protein